MIEQHYTDEALLSLLDARGSDTLLSDPHMAACATCADALESYKDIAGLLNEKEVWDEEDAVFESAPVPETLSRIRAFADATAREDADAVQLVNELLELPSEWWGEEVRNDDRYHTAGVVRRLIAVAYEMDNLPQQALTLSELCVELVDHLDATRYADTSRMVLRGLALRQHGWALTVVGRDRQAIAAARQAVGSFERCVGAEVERGRGLVLVSLIERQLESYEAALQAARGAAEIFARYGVEDRLHAAKWAEANVLVMSGRYREAIDAFRCIESKIAGKPNDLAGLIVNTAYCYSELREFDRALPQYDFALGVYESVGNLPETLRVRSMIAAVYASRGDLVEAGRRYSEVRGRFASMGLTRDVALADLALAEIAVGQERFADAASMCSQVIAYFESIDVKYGKSAVAALTYLREAVEQMKANRAVAEAVRRYVTRLPQQPNLLFAPPPLP